jgi:hypothetical protein
MISDDIVKEDFIVQVLERDMNRIYGAQLEIARSNTYVEGRKLKKRVRKGKGLGSRTGALVESLENPDFIIQTSGEKFIVSAKIVTHMRFLDMKRHGDWRIYNRQVWGILYNNSLKDIRNNCGRAIADSVGESLHETFGAEEGGVES